MEPKSEKRKFKRFLIEFEADVTATDSQAESFSDRAVLKNISGEGMNFVTRQPKRYYIGQLLELVIYLPGTEEVKACMKVKATVVRMDSADSMTEGPDHEMSIALKLDTPLHFERLDLT